MARSLTTVVLGSLTEVGRLDPRVAAGKDNPARALGDALLPPPLMRRAEPSCSFGVRFFLSSVSLLGELRPDVGIVTVRPETRMQDPHPGICRRMDLLQSSAPPRHARRIVKAHVPVTYPRTRRRADRERRVRPETPAAAGHLVRVSDGTRTRGRLDHNQELYQLSYAHRAAQNLAVAGRGASPCDHPSMSFELGDPVPAFTLDDTAGTAHAVPADPAPPATVLIVTCNHCPYVIAWNPRLRAAAEDYAARDVRFLACLLYTSPSPRDS